MAARPWFNAPTELFNGMINPLTSLRIKGIIWYQGEQNADKPAQYRILFPALIRDWRKHWGDELPFLFVQLAGFGVDQPESVECNWAALREAQAMALQLPKTGMATAIDLGDPDDIHPRNKQDVADRLALAAGRVAYRENVVYSGPTYQSMQVEGNHIRVRFSNVGGGLSLKGKYGYVNGFEIAGPDHQFVWAHARIEGSDILVSADSVAEPVAVRYDWSNTPDGNVFNHEGLPAVPFRAEGLDNSRADDLRKPALSEALLP
jgi:sialate O-acetylesterase